MNRKDRTILSKIKTSYVVAMIDGDSSITEWE